MFLKRLSPVPARHSVMQLCFVYGSQHLWNINVWEYLCALSAAGLILSLWYQDRFIKHLRWRHSVQKSVEAYPQADAFVSNYPGIADEISVLISMINASFEKLAVTDDPQELLNNVQVINQNTLRLVALTQQLLEAEDVLLKDEILIQKEGTVDNLNATETIDDMDFVQLTADDIFLKKLNDTILLHIAEPELDVDRLSDIMNMSRRNLFRKIKSISGQTPAEMINIMRLEQAAQLLLNSDDRMYEIAERVGFRSRIVFTRNFTRQFGVSPTEYGKRRLKCLSAKSEENVTNLN